MKQQLLSLRLKNRAFTLIEVTLALGVAGFCLVTLFGLLPIGLASNQVSMDQTVAANITSAIQGDLNCFQPIISGTTSHFGFSVPAAGSGTLPSTPQTIYLAADGSPTGVVGNGPVTSGSAISMFRATLGFAPPAASQRVATAVRILITWPAMADPAPGAWPKNYAGSYEADTALNRN